MFILFIISLFVAGIATGWRNLLSDIPRLNTLVQRLPYIPRKAITCGFCFTFWLALAVTLIINPLPEFTPVFYNEAPAWVRDVTIICMRWMSVAMLAVIIRFGYVVLQELVYYQVHHIRGQHKH